MLARVIMQPPDGMEVDHWDHLPLDNRRSNLRIVTPNENSRNRRTRPNNTSGQPGVSWHEVASKWFAYINVDSKRINLGYYEYYEDACRVRRDAEVKYFGVHRYEESLIDDSLREQIKQLLVWNQAAMTAYTLGS
jgi:hypothetical protein